MVANIKMYICHIYAHPIGRKIYKLSEADRDDDMILYFYFA